MLEELLLVVWIICFLSLWCRYFCRRKNRRFLTNRQYNELKDARITLGTIILFYMANVLPFYVSFCHILRYEPSYTAARVSQFGIVVNSTLKFFIYISLSRRFRIGFLSIFRRNITEEDDGDEDKLVVLKPRKRRIQPHDQRQW